MDILKKNMPDNIVCQAYFLRYFELQIFLTDHPNIPWSALVMDWRIG
jgi:hypothetical protein